MGKYVTLPSIDVKTLLDLTTSIENNNPRIKVIETEVKELTIKATVYGEHVSTQDIVTQAGGQCRKSEMLLNAFPHFKDKSPKAK